MLKALMYRPIGILITLLAVVGLGLIAYFNIPLQLLPNGYSSPFIWLSIPTLSSAPEENELVIAQPIEDALSTLPDLKELESYIRSDNVNFHINLYPNADVDLAYQRVRARLKKEIPNLPEGARFAYMWRHDPNDDPVLVVGLSYADHLDDPSILIEEKLVKAIERVSGVSNVELAGVKTKQVRIIIDQHLLSQYGLQASTINEILQKNDFTMSAGKIRSEKEELMVRMISKFERIETIKNLPITENLKLQDIAKIIIAPDDAPLIHRVNGKSAISIVVYKASTANTIEVSAKVWQTITEIVEKQPQFKDFELMRFFDQGQLIQNSLKQLNQSALLGALIAMICLYYFLRSFKLTLLITLAIPLCLLMSIALLYLQGESLNLLSMMGLVISVGMVIDNAIVVMENIEQRRKRGQSPQDSAIESAKEVGMAITLATLTTIVVFLPLTLLSKEAALSFFLSKLGATVTYALVASLVVALIHFPMASVWIPWVRNAFHLHPKTEILDRSPPSNASIPPSNASQLQLYPKYAKIVQWTLDHRLKASVCLLLFMCSIAYPLKNLKRINQQGGESFGSLRVSVVGPANGPHEKLDQIAKEVEGRLWKQKEELGIASVVAQRGFSAEHVRITCYLNPKPKSNLNARDRNQKIKSLLPQRPGYRIQIGRPSQQQGGGDGVQISVYGPNLATTSMYAKEVVQRLKQLSSVDDIELDIPEGGMELKINLNPELSYLLGASPMESAFQISQQLQKRKIGEMVVDDQQLDLMIESQQTRPTQFQENGQNQDIQTKVANLIFVGTPQSPQSPQSLQSPQSPKEIQVNQSTDISLEIGPGKILRKDRRVHITLMLVGDDVKMMEDLKRVVPQIRLPVGYGIHQGNRLIEQKQNESSGLMASLVGIALVFCIMGLLFESFLLPISILITIPLAFVGTIWTLWLSDTPLEVMAMIGCVILIGVVVNHGIVLIDQVQQRRLTETDRNLVLINVTQERIRPILMTTLTTICGLIPMAFSQGDGMGIDYSPLGKVVLGGMVTSAFLTLFALPVFYSILDDLSLLGQRIRKISLKNHIFF
jgi:HAE1 family hydrophobic/amphiphilic exporter-1